MHRVTTVVLSVICVALLGVATNVATGALPDSWEPYLWLAWPLLVALIVTLVVLEVARNRENRPVPMTSPERARQVLLGRVRRYWVTNVLERSLYNEVRIELGLTATADTQRHPWDVLAEQANGTPLMLTDGVAMGNVFTQLDQAMVILGEPGAGKTTMLLELARDLLNLAERDPTAPIPVVVNLSSWAIYRRPIAQWLTEQLTERYGMPTDQATRWVMAGEILPLLDGLDEVAAEHRDRCAAAIAEFHRQQPLTAIAFCCRTVEYAQLSQQVPVYGTVRIQPLTRPQIEQFLDRAGTALAGLRSALVVDTELWEFADSPLLLSIMALAYADGPEPAGDPDGGEAPSGRRRLFTHYVRAMLRQRTHPRHHPDQTVRYLAALAYQLRADGQTVFVLDRIAETWSPRYFRIPTADTIARWISSVGAAVLLGAAGWFLLDWPGALAGAAVGVVTAAGMSMIQYDDLCAISSAVRRENVRSYGVDWITEFWRDLRGIYNEAEPVPVSGLSALAVGAAFTTATSIRIGTDAGHGMAIGIGIGYGLGFLAAALVSLGVTATAIFEMYSRSHPTIVVRREVPSPVLRHRLRFAVRVAPVLGLVTGTIAGLAVAWPGTTAEAVRFGALMGTSSAVFLLILVALAPIMEQWLVRRRLARQDVVPYPILPFLEYAVQCLFLRNVGDGYIFVHRELLDFFADRWNPAREGLPRAGSATPNRTG